MRKQRHTWILTPGLHDSKWFEVNGMGVPPPFQLEWAHDFVQSILTQQNLSQTSKTRSTHSVILPLEYSTTIYNFLNWWTDVWEQNSRNCRQKLSLGRARGRHTLSGGVQVQKCTHAVFLSQTSWQPFPSPLLCTEEGAEPSYSEPGQHCITSLRLHLSYGKPLPHPSGHWITNINSCAWQVSSSFKSDEMWKISRGLTLSYDTARTHSSFLLHQPRNRHRPLGFQRLPDKAPETQDPMEWF